MAAGARQRLREHLGGLRPRHTEAAVDDEERHAVHTQRTRFAHVGGDRIGIGVAREHLTDLGFVEPGLDRERCQRFGFEHRPAFGEVGAEQPLDLVLTEKGMLLLDGAPITFEALPPRLVAAREAKPDRQVLIEAEKEVPHEQVVRLLDAVRTAGFTGVGIGVRASDRAR